MGIIKDFSNSVKLSNALTPLVRTADADAASIDLKGFRNAAFINHIGITGDTLSGSVLLELEVQVSDDDSAWSAAPDADVKDTVSATRTGTVAVINADAEDDVVVLAEYTGTARYVRMHHSFTGTHTNGIETSVIGMLMNPNEQPNV